LLPEAIETWSVALLREILPRHLEIIFEINQYFLDEVRVHYRGNEDRVIALSIIGEDNDKYVRMANLSCVGSHTVNGVASLHTHLLKEGMLNDLDNLWPEKIINITNGVTPRRFMRLANPGLSQLISSKIGDSWISNLEELQQLEEFSDDKTFQHEWGQVKLNAKQNLSSLIYERSGILVNPQSLVSLHAKRIHEYKRQHLNLLHILTLYNRIKDNPNDETIARTFIFSGKAAPGYTMAKLIIKLINAVADVIDQDQEVRGRLKVFFLPNFNVKNAQHFYPAADLSEQISTAGKEASGTGNMKFSMNGALTIGTLDGANIEIRDAVGPENFFLFGHSAEQIQLIQRQGYEARRYYEQDEELRASIDLIDSGIFSHGDHDLFKPITQSLLNADPFILMADYRSYIDCQSHISECYTHRDSWNKMSILNVARMGVFSSDRAVREYCENIWHVQPVTVKM
ncbi:MAG: glycogen/starch/alpha-glucan family phosphorylase, partial [Pseudomonadales bacterium]|nr:glycogen/starch/alpha-glucan family phosphorylase [Pseudomonadales bacterium]